MKSTKPLRFLHVSTRYALRVVSVSPYITEFVKKEPGVTYRRAEPKPKRPGRMRRLRLKHERARQALWDARQAAMSVIAP